jgi:uncharacterized OB-fold protein
MTQQYRICHNCGASLAPYQAYCPRCGAQYIEPNVLYNSHSVDQQARFAWVRSTPGLVKRR